MLLLTQIFIYVNLEANFRCYFKPVWGRIGEPPGGKNRAPAYVGARFFMFRPFQFEAVLEPMFGPLGGPLGSLFWLKPRLEIG